MSSYSKELNSDVLGIKTPTVYDSNIEEWLMLAGNYIQNTSGIWIPQKGTDSGEALTHLSGNSIPEDEAIPTKLTGSNLQDSEALPVKRRPITKTQIAEDLTITAGAIATLEDTLEQDDSPESISVFARATAIHDFLLEFNDLAKLNVLGITPGYAINTIKVTSTSNTATILKTDVQSNRQSYRIQNNDASDQVYSVVKYEWRR